MPHTQTLALWVKVNLACVCVPRSEVNKTANCVFYGAVRRVYQSTLYLFNITPFPGIRVNVISLTHKKSRAYLPAGRYADT